MHLFEKWGKKLLMKVKLPGPLPGFVCPDEMPVNWQVLILPTECGNLKYSICRPLVKRK